MDGLVDCMLNLNRAHEPRGPEYESHQIFCTAGTKIERSLHNTQLRDEKSHQYNPKVSKSSDLQ